jgi:endoribonuclease Dicer
MISMFMRRNPVEQLFPQFPEWLYDCAPQSGVDCYVHIIHMNPAYEEPETSRKKFFRNLLMSHEEFGIVTRRKLPDVILPIFLYSMLHSYLIGIIVFQICQFPVFMDLGEVDVSIKTNAYVTRFTDEEIERLFSFHRFIFLDVLQVVKGFLVADRSHKENSYFVVPLSVAGKLNGEFVARQTFLELKIMQFCARR